MSLKTLEERRLKFNFCNLIELNDHALEMYYKTRYTRYLFQYSERILMNGSELSPDDKLLCLIPGGVIFKDTDIIETNGIVPGEDDFIKDELKQLPEDVYILDNKILRSKVKAYKIFLESRSLTSSHGTPQKQPSHLFIALLHFYLVNNNERIMLGIDGQKEYSSITKGNAEEIAIAYSWTAKYSSKKILLLVENCKEDLYRYGPTGNKKSFNGRNLLFLTIINHLKDNNKAKSLDQVLREYKSHFLPLNKDYLGDHTPESYFNSHLI